MAKEQETMAAQSELTREDARKTILEDYKLANISRETSLLGRREVLTGKAKFGIFGDGKEVPQIAMAKFFENGDFRSGYYRDQTFMMSIGQLTVQEFFAQLYAHTDVDAEPASGGRSMNGHFATRNLEDDGSWKNLMDQPNVSADISPTAGQMPRLLGLAQASKVYKENEALHHMTQFSLKGNEVAFGTIGDSSTSEGLFWETINAAGVLQVPMVVSVWDDGHGISVPKKYQTTKESISAVLAGFQRTETQAGFELFKVKGWDYVALIETYSKAVELARTEHIPVLIHVEELTQPQGHSTSGSHERYKSKERLAWETEYDCIRQMGLWMIEKGIATEEELETIKKEAQKHVREAKKQAWENYLNPIKSEKEAVLQLAASIAEKSSQAQKIEAAIAILKASTEPIRKEIMGLAKQTLRWSRGEAIDERNALIQWLQSNQALNDDRYSSHLYSQSSHSPLKTDMIAPQTGAEAKQVDGRIVLRENFEVLLSNYPEVLIFGEDSGKIGGVNQGLEGLQEKFGQLRVSDTGIREATILGQGIGMAMRGLRPIAEIQYLDYLLYALQIMSDDLATVHYRTKGGQKAPLIVRTRGHRLEGIWHSGSPMGMIIHALRGIHVCVPRNFTEAAGFYNTLLKGDDPALVIEPLNGYRSKEIMPKNLGEFTTPLGIPEVLTTGSDLTIVSYGSTCNLAIDAVKQLEEVGISAELIDVRTLLPFDTEHRIVESLKKTNRVLVVDEDVPGGASAFILQQVLETQSGYYYLDAEPKTLSAKAHRPAYGTDGDYFSKPSVEDIFDTAYAMMHEADPQQFPELYA
jgi:pyruvate/2-oxoglutarate/acetoin dehydrogenase E1 component/TPP-dependent pyruvate/acetoin dehydrogenase alpha subunit